MKRILVLGFTAAIISFSISSHADFTFHSNVNNACQYIPGNWAGTGKAYNWLLGECLYHGSGSSTDLDESGNFTINVSADKDSGSRLCPAHAEKQLVGVCKDGNVTIITEYGELKGGFTQNAGDASGTLSIMPGMSAEVNLTFQRAG